MARMTVEELKRRKATADHHRAALEAVNTAAGDVVARSGLSAEDLVRVDAENKHGPGLAARASLNEKMKHSLESVVRAQRVTASAPTDEEQKRADALQGLFDAACVHGPLFARDLGERLLQFAARPTAAGLKARMSTQGQHTTTKG